MASSSTVVSRLSSSLRPIALLKLTRKSTVTLDAPLLKPVSPSLSSSYARRISCSSRLPVELSCLESMMPLHSAIASARLTSSLPLESGFWGLIPQGISMPL